MVGGYELWQKENHLDPVVNRDKEKLILIREGDMLSSSRPHPPLPRLIIYVNNTFGYSEWHIYHKHIPWFTTKLRRKTSFKTVSNSGVLITRRIPSFWSDFKAAETIKWTSIVQLGKIVSLILIARLLKFKYFNLESNFQAYLYIIQHKAVIKIYNYSLFARSFTHN